ncbi:MAG TPA: FGGY family carbohydrate kinase [Flavitalea sp.]|nr:FGGY family carbohydrate kinase [Flavitalea sp.]
MKYLIGYDIGSSSVKAALVEIETGKPVATVFSPATEMPIASPRQGFAEQDPNMWWNELINASGQLRQKTGFQQDEIASIGISYQMHGLVCVDRSLKSLRPSIIWCDSRAVDIGNTAMKDLGEQFCLQRFLNAPGNFTASKLKWVKENEPALYEKIYKVMLPGDYIAMRLSGEVSTTVSGLSEGIFWDYSTNGIATSLLKEYGIDEALLSPIVETFGVQARLSEDAARLIHIKAGTPIGYRAGDQPNNAYSLNVLEPGEIAATAGTSGVVYGVTDSKPYDLKSRVNTFVHVNHTDEKPRYGVLLCINGTGILNSWLRKNFFDGVSYDAMNQQAQQVPVGAEGVKFYPFGNGSERILENEDMGARLKDLHFNRHHRGHIARAAQEGIVFAMNYGMEIMRGMNMNLQTIRAGYANMFLSDVFASTFANSSGCTIELFNTDGALGAARASGVGAGVYAGFAESFTGMEMIKRIEPDKEQAKETQQVYHDWKAGM